ncbi:hypothetical protein [Streptomyces xiamenensis]|uniref:hypothetical protein n=1 Tax=Streptomyces xiamenensis TaxID=408015 RepID=UPI0035DC2B9B
MRAGQVGSKNGDDVPPGRRKLAEVLQALYRQLEVTSLADAGERFSSMGCAKDPGQISRYLNGRTLPPQGFVRVLFDLAVKRSGGAHVGMGWAEVQEAYDSAERTQCKQCFQLKEEIRALREAAAGPDGSAGGSDPEAGEQGAAVTEAIASSPATRLPVPRDEGDRQLSSRDASAARVIASGLVNRAGTLTAHGSRSALLELLQGAAGVLSPGECAAAVAAFHRQETAESAQFADTLLRIYARERPAEDVMAAALGLLEGQGLSADAGALLKAALG